MQTQRLQTCLIDPPRNRHRIDIAEESIVDLAKDIRDRGLMNPITVRPTGDRFEVVAGERRYTAMKYLGWPLIECRITEQISDEACEALRLAENLQRENLSPFEEAIQITALYHIQKSDIELTAKACHRSTGWVTDRLALYCIPPELQPLVHTKQLSIGSALQLARVEDDRDRQYFTRLAMHDGCTVAVLTRWINEYHTSKLAQPDAPPNLPDMPPPGQSVVVYLQCDLCDEPADTRTRAPKFVCTTCQSMWLDFRAACAEARHVHAATQQLEETRQ